LSLFAWCFPGGSIVKKAIPITLAGIGFLLGSQIASEITVKVGASSTEQQVNIIQALTIATMAIYVVFTIGYSAAKARCARLWVPEELELDDEHNQSLRLEVRCIGTGELSVSVSVLELRDANGAPIDESAINGRPLPWAFHDKTPVREMRLRAHPFPKRSVTVFYFMNDHLHVYGLDGKDTSQVFALHRQGSEALCRVFVKLFVFADLSKPIEKWFQIERDDRLKTRYRSAQLLDLPASCG